MNAKDNWRAIKGLLPYLWPKSALELRIRVVAALFCLLLAKLATVSVPLFYKRAVDALGVHAPAVVVAPVAIIVLYGLLRVSGQLLGELRDAIFAKVAQRAVRDIGLATFRHLHSLVCASTSIARPAA